MCERPLSAKIGRGIPQKLDLISIGLVNDTGEHEFYREIDKLPLEQCSNFTLDMVLPLLERGKTQRTMSEFAMSFVSGSQVSGNRAISSPTLNPIS